MGEGGWAARPRRSGAKRGVWLVYAIKLLFAVLLLSAVFAPFLRGAMRGLIGDKDYWRVWMIIVATAVASFLSMRPPVFMVLVALIGLFSPRLLGGGTLGRLTAWWLLYVLFPPISVSAEGVPGINRIIELMAHRVLSLVVLVPAVFELLGNKQVRPNRMTRWTDLAFIAYPTMLILTAIPISSGTNVARSVVETTLDLLLPYWVTTRAIRSAADLKHLCVRLAIGLAFLAAVGLMESALRKNVYSELQFIVGVIWQATHRLMRGPFLRVQSTFPVPIVMAYVMTIGFCLWSWLGRTSTASRRMRLLVSLGFFLAMVATFSRGPLLGWASFVLTLFALRWISPYKYLFGLTVLFGVAVGASVTGTDEWAYEALKTVFGSSAADTSSIDYRRKLLETAVALIKQSPTWGVPNYMAYMQDLRQGEGLIDIVNTYVAVALANGLVGLTLFMSPHALVLVRLLRRLNSYEERPRRSTGSFPATMVGATVASLLTIFTTSDFSAVPRMLLFLVAVPTAWLAFDRAEQRRADEVVPVGDEVAPRGHPRFAPIPQEPGWQEPNWR
jgi:hypothetical protein